MPVKSNWLIAYESGGPLCVQDLASPSTVLECRCARLRGEVWVALLRLTKPKKRFAQVAALVLTLGRAWVEAPTGGLALTASEVDDARIRAHVLKEATGGWVWLAQVAPPLTQVEEPKEEVTRDWARELEAEQRARGALMELNARLRAELDKRTALVEELRAELDNRSALIEELRADARRKDALLEELQARPAPIVMQEELSFELRYPYGVPRRAPIKRSSLPATFPSGAPATLEYHVALFDFRPGYDIDDVYDGPPVQEGRPLRRRSWYVEHLCETGYAPGIDVDDAMVEQLRQWKREARTV